MWSARFQSHMNHVSVSPTDGNGPTQGQRKTLTRVGIEPTTFGLDLRRSTDWATRTEKNSDQGGNWTHDLRVRSPPLYRLSYKVRQEQAVGSEDVKVTAMNMYKYKERLRLYNSHPGQSFSLSLCGPISICRANTHMVHMGLKSSTSHYTLFS